jgi:hypothetical protein
MMEKLVEVTMRIPVADKRKLDELARHSRLSRSRLGSLGLAWLLAHPETVLTVLAPADRSAAA